jgi:hypothetical protein
LAYPRVRLTTPTEVEDKWKTLEDRAAAAEKEARRWRASDKEARADLAALGKQHQAFIQQQASAIKKAVSAAHGEMVLELGKLGSALHDARKALSRSGSESTWRHKARVATAERQAELSRVRLELREKERLLAAQATRLQQLEARAEHSKLNMAAAEQGRAAAVQDRAAAEAVAADAETEVEQCEFALEAEKEERLSALSQMQAQLKASEVQVGKVIARLQEMVERRLRIDDLPKSRNWDVSAASSAVYRSKEVPILPVEPSVHAFGAHQSTHYG